MNEAWRLDQRFCDFIAWVILREGSQYEDVPGDRGGPTRYGIDLNSHKWLGADGIRNMTEDQAKDIYYGEAWIKIHAPEMPFPIGEMVSDIDINGGHAIAWLQACINGYIRPRSITMDGIWGRQTQQSLQDCTPSIIEQCMMIKRNAYFEGLAQNVTGDRQFLDGWLSRDRLLTQYIASESPHLQAIAHPSDYLT